MDSLQLPVDADGYITIFDGKHLMDGVVMARTEFLPNGLSKTVASSLTVPVAVKRRMVMAETRSLPTNSKLRTGNGMEGFQRR